MITQDALRFYQSHAVYDNFRGVVVGREEADNIARALGSTNKAAILQNHGLLTVGASVDEAAFWFLSLERTCQAQLLADAAAAAATGEQRYFASDDGHASGARDRAWPLAA